MLKLSLTIIAIALPDCINPSFIGGQLFVATGRQPGRRAAAFTLAVWVVTFVFGVAMALGLGSLILSLVPKPGATVKYALITAAGGVMILGAIIVWIRRTALTKTPTDQGGADPGGTRGGSPAFIGACLGAVELPTAFPYFAAIALIVGSGVSSPEKLTLIGLYCVVYTLPLIVIAVGLALMGERAERALLPMGAWLLGHWPLIAAPVMATIGVAAVAFGIIELNSV
jgi:cytochrome c biogenesis protein CcdA